MNTAHGSADKVEILPVAGLPEFRPGDDLASVLAEAAPWLRDGDVLVVTSKVVSKCEGRIVTAPSDPEERDTLRRKLIDSEAVRVLARKGRTLITEFDPFVFFNIYFPNGGRGPEWVQHKLAFYTRFLEGVDAYRQQGRSVIACGDVNTSFAEIDIARPKENAKTSGFLPEEREAMGEFFRAGLIDTFRHKRPEAVKYSWWDQRTGARAKGIGWRLDYFLITPDLLDNVVDADIHDEVMGSDHCPVSLELKM